MQVLPVQHPVNPSIPHNLLNPAPHPSSGPVPPGLLQLPASGPPGICHQTATTDPECCGTPDIQLYQIYAHHPAAHWPPLAACYGSHQIQYIGACIPGSQGISPCLHPTAHQTLHTWQTCTLCYLWTSGAPHPSHLHISFTTSLCSGPRDDFPVDVRTAETLTTFKRRQKTHLFRLHLSLPPSLITSYLAHKWFDRLWHLCMCVILAFGVCSCQPWYAIFIADYSSLILVFSMWSF